MIVLPEDAEELAKLGTWAFDLEAGVGRWSAGMCRIHGVDPCEEMDSEAMLAFVHPDDAPRLTRMIDDLRSDPSVVPDEGIVIQYRALRPSGETREVRVHGRVVAGIWQGVAQDVSDQRIAERELQAHYAIGQTVREWVSFEEGLVSLLRRLGTALGYPIGVLWTPHEDGMRAKVSWSAPELSASLFETTTMSTTLPPGVGIPAHVFETERPVILDDLVGYLDEERAEAARGLGLQSRMAFPVVDGGPPLAVIALYSVDRRDWPPRMHDTLADLGQRLAGFLNQRRAEFKPRRLSDRELQILRLASNGLSSRLIGEQLFISPATVKTHFEHIYEKLGVGDRTAAVAFGLRTGLIS
jgi:DNA-binding CsgD family transcriptional regulator